MDFSNVDPAAAITNGVLFAIYLKLWTINDKLGKK